MHACAVSLSPGHPLPPSPWVPPPPYLLQAQPFLQHALQLELILKGSRVVPPRKPAAAAGQKLLEPRLGLPPRPLLRGAVQGTSALCSGDGGCRRSGGGGGGFGEYCKPCLQNRRRAWWQAGFDAWSLARRSLRLYADSKSQRCSIVAATASLSGGNNPLQGYRVMLTSCRAAAAARTTAWGRLVGKAEAG